MRFPASNLLPSNAERRWKKWFFFRHVFEIVKRNETIKWSASLEPELKTSHDRKKLALPFAATRWWRLGAKSCNKIHDGLQSIHMLLLEINPQHQTFMKHPTDGRVAAKYAQKNSQIAIIKIVFFVLNFIIVIAAHVLYNQLAFVAEGVLACARRWICTIDRRDCVELLVGFKSWYSWLLRLKERWRDSNWQNKSNRRFCWDSNS